MKKFPYLYLYLTGCLFVGIFWSVLSAIVLALIGLIFSLLKWLSDFERNKFKRLGDELFSWDGNGNFEVKVFRDNNDNEIFSPSWMKLEIVYDAVLYPEKESSKIIVFVQGVPVGYLHKSDANAFRRRLGSKKLTGFPTECKIKLKSKSKVDYSLWLDIKPFNTQKNASNTE